MTLNLLIPANPMVNLIFMNTRVDSTQLSARLQGYYETIPLPDAVGWVNEEGKLRGMPRNDRATHIASLALFAYDWIAGDMIVTGGADPNGDVTDLAEAWLMDYVMPHYEVHYAPSVTRKGEPPTTRPE
jgi:hypothetical protein